MLSPWSTARSCPPHPGSADIINARPDVIWVLECGELFNSSMFERDVSIEITSASSAVMDGMMSLNSQ